MRRSLGLLIATVAVAGSIATAAPARAGTCPLDNEHVPETAGKAVCVAVITVAETVCRALPSACS